MTFECKVNIKFNLILIKPINNLSLKNTGILLIGRNKLSTVVELIRYHNYRNLVIIGFYSTISL